MTAARRVHLAQSALGLTACGLVAAALPAEAHRAPAAWWRDTPPAWRCARCRRALAAWHAARTRRSHTLPEWSALR